jgi:prophage antirepressor-like protein
MNDLQVFTNERLGQIRAIEYDGKPYFIGKDIAERLGYSNTRDALAKHVDSEDKANVAIHDGSQRRSLVAINESGVYSLIFGSKLETAKEFKRWVTSEVLPEIRRTGGYNSQQSDEFKAKRLEIMMINAKARLLKEQNKHIELMIKNPEYTTTEDLPPVVPKTYTATEVATMLGVSANRIGRLSNANGLKDKAYGEWYKEPLANGKEVESFRYNENGVNKLRELLKD